VLLVVLQLCNEGEGSEGNIRSTRWTEYLYAGQVDLGQATGAGKNIQECERECVDGVVLEWVSYVLGATEEGQVPGNNEQVTVDSLQFCWDCLLRMNSVPSSYKKV